MKILAVGIAVLDIIDLVERYPREDEEVRALSRRRVRGGNATNTLVVLSQLGHRGAWAGVLAQDAEAEIILADLRRYTIDLRWVTRYPEGHSPLSCIWRSRASGSRTIVHYRDLPEYTAAAFDRIPLGEFHWIHLEGRAPEETGPMLRRIRERGFPGRVSLEVEKPRPGIEGLLQGPDLLFFSRDYARARGHTEAASFLRAQRPRTTARWLFCAWGREGAWALEGDGAPRHQPAPEVEAVDTVAAGDVFNAAVIDALGAGCTTWEALRRGVALAAFKCTQEGLDGLVEAFRHAP